MNVSFSSMTERSKCRYHIEKKKQDPNRNPESTSGGSRVTAPGPLGAFVAFLSFHLVSSPARGQPSPQSTVQSRARGSGCLQGNRDRLSVASTAPSESCKRISHVTGKNARGELCLRMRRNHSARRVCGTGVSLGASHRAPSSPAAGGVRGPRCTESPRQQVHRPSSGE